MKTPIATAPSIVMRAGAEDSASDPAGAVGPRIACGVISRWRAETVANR